MRLLLALPDQDSVDLMRTVLDSALSLTCLAIEAAEVRSYSELISRVEAGLDDIILLDWQLASSETPRLVRDILHRDPKLRIVVVLPERYRQYRQLVWDAGACNGIPKEHVDQEWLSTVLCLMQRAMQREASLLARM